MCYRCSLCGEVSEKGQALLRHAKIIADSRQDRAKSARSIPNSSAQERPLCHVCFRRLSTGVTEEQLISKLRLEGKYNPYKSRKIVAYDGLTMYFGLDAIRFSQSGEKPLLVKDKRTGEKRQIADVPLLALPAKAIDFGDGDYPSNDGSNSGGA